MRPFGTLLSPSADPVLVARPVEVCKNDAPTGETTLADTARVDVPRTDPTPASSTPILQPPTPSTATLMSTPPGRAVEPRMQPPTVDVAHTGLAAELLATASGHVEALSAKSPATLQERAGALVASGMLQLESILEPLRAQLPSQKSSLSRGIYYVCELQQAAIDGGFTLAPEVASGWADPKYFEKSGLCGYTVKNRVSASAALDAFLCGPTVADCSGVLLAIQYRAVRQILGSERFDAAFGSASASGASWELMRLDRSGLGEDNPLNAFVTSSPAALCANEGRGAGSPRDLLAVGDSAYIDGVPGYFERHPVGACGGYNVVVVGKTRDGELLFSGFGLGPEPKTEDEICEILRTGYALAPTPADVAARQRSQLRRLKQPGALELREVPRAGGLDCIGSMRVMADNLAEALKLSPAAVGTYVYKAIQAQRDARESLARISWML